MQIDPAVEWRRLTEQYRSMSDEELRELAQDFVNLTETAQQALRQEMRSRGLGEPGVEEASQPTNVPRAPGTAHTEPERGPEHPAFRTGLLGRMPALIPDAPDGAVNESGQEYTWKIVVRDCETAGEAQYLVNALRSAGLDGWVQWPREFGQGYSRVLVAADQLERARVIAAQPIPQKIIDESKIEVPEFVEPKCPKCGAEDPILESIESVNTWRCEECETEWSDSAESRDGGPGSIDVSGS